MCGMCGQRLFPGQWWNVCTQMPCLYTANLHHSGAHLQAEIEKRTCWTVTGKANTSFLAYLGVLHLSLFWWRNKTNSQPWRDDTNDTTRGGAGLVPSPRWWYYWEESTWIVDYCGHFVFLVCLGIRCIYHLSAVEVKPSAGCQQTPRQSCLRTPSLQTHELTDLRLFQRRSSWVMPSRPSSAWLTHGELLTKKTPGAPPKSWAYVGIISDISE
jgi:hypothetical protein